VFSVFYYYILPKALSKSAITQSRRGTEFSLVSLYKFNCWRLVGFNIHSLKYFSVPQCPRLPAGRSVFSVFYYYILPKALSKSAITQSRRGTEFSLVSLYKFNCWRLVGFNIHSLKYFSVPQCPRLPAGRSVFSIFYYYILPKALSKSAIISSMCSMPTDTLSRLGVTPAAACSCWLSC